MNAAAFPTAAYQAHVSALDALSDDGRLDYVLTLGRSLDEAQRRRTIDDGEEMPGCQARVWIARCAAHDGGVAFTGASEATIVQGLVRIMAESFSGLQMAALRSLHIRVVRAFPLGAMTMHRQVGMIAMLKHMQKMDPK